MSMSQLLSKRSILIFHLQTLYCRMSQNIQDSWNIQETRNLKRNVNDHHKFEIRTFIGVLGHPMGCIWIISFFLREGGSGKSRDMRFNKPFLAINEHNKFLSWKYKNSELTGWQMIFRKIFCRKIKDLICKQKLLRSYVFEHLIQIFKNEGVCPALAYKHTSHHTIVPHRNAAYIFKETDCNL